MVCTDNFETINKLIPEDLEDQIVFSDDELIKGPIVLADALRCAMTAAPDLKQEITSA